LINEITAAIKEKIAWIAVTKKQNLLKLADLRFANCWISGEGRYFTGERVKENASSNVL
jgi:hypothetical protein